MREQCKGESSMKDERRFSFVLSFIITETGTVTDSDADTNTDTDTDTDRYRY